MRKVGIGRQSLSNILVYEKSEKKKHPCYLDARSYFPSSIPFLKISTFQTLQFENLK
jgi:hypothetical protein